MDEIGLWRGKSAGNPLTFEQNCSIMKAQGEKKRAKRTAFSTVRFFLYWKVHRTRFVNLY